MKVLLTGSNGQLGYDFQKLFEKLKIAYDATDYKELDITKIDKLREYVKERNYTHIINCAAYNDVDKAEEEVEACYRLNSYAPRDLAIVAKEIGAVFITYSTDFVFDGKKGKPYTEEDMPNPLSIYGKSKLEGEKIVLEVYKKTFIIRTSWLFGIGNNNFNKQVIEWSKRKGNLNIVDDQVSSPTYSKDLAEYSWELIKTNKFGLYHLSSGGECSKYEQARYVLDSIGWTGELGRAKTKDFKIPAKRSEYSKLSNEKVEGIIGKMMPSWKEAMDKFFEELS